MSPCPPRQPRQHYCSAITKRESGRDGTDLLPRRATYQNPAPTTSPASFARRHTTSKHDPSKSGSDGTAGPRCPFGRFSAVSGDLPRRPTESAGSRPKRYDVLAGIELAPPWGRLLLARRESGSLGRQPRAHCRRSVVLRGREFLPVRDFCSCGSAVCWPRRSGQTSCAETGSVVVTTRRARPVLSVRRETRAAASPRP